MDHSGIEVRSLRRQVYEHLKLLMNRGQLRPGRFLDLTALSREIGISRTPLRDALLRLECEGFVEILPRRGVRVVELTTDRIRDIYEILGALESSALRSLAGRAPASMAASMDRLNRAMRESLDASDFDAFYDTNLAFHDCYLDLSDNRELIGRVRVLKQRLYDFPRNPGFVPEWERRSLAEHGAMIGLIAEDRVAEAGDFLRDVHWSFAVQEPFIRRYYAAERGSPAPQRGLA